MIIFVHLCCNCPSFSYSAVNNTISIFMYFRFNNMICVLVNSVGLICVSQLISKAICLRTNLAMYAVL